MSRRRGSHHCSCRSRRRRHSVGPLLLLMRLDMLLEVVLAAKLFVAGGDRAEEGLEAGVDALVPRELLVARKAFLAAAEVAGERSLA